MRNRDIYAHAKPRIEIVSGDEMCDRTVHVTRIRNRNLLALELRRVIRYILLCNGEQEPALRLPLGTSSVVNSAQLARSGRMRRNQKSQRREQPHLDSLRRRRKPVKVISRPTIRNDVMTGKCSMCGARVKVCPNRISPQLFRRFQSINSIRVSIEVYEHSVCSINRPAFNI